MGKIILKGYYGYGNFGDDILMITTYWLLKEIFPSYEIIVCSDSREGNYIHSLLEKSIRVVSSNSGVHADWIVHGGGGVFFDFNEGERKFSQLNQLIKWIGYKRFTKAYNLTGKLRGARNIESRFRAGLGVGIGTYTRSSRKFYTDILSLSDFDFLLVRDEESMALLNGYNFSYPVQLATDLAFLSEYWNKWPLSEAQPESNTIGFILRDWHYNNNAYLQVVLKVLLDLQGQGTRIKLFSLDKKGDQVFIQEFSRHFPITVWAPPEITIQNFLLEISECSVIVSSRAHGAIVSACLGIPSACLAIEPKLEKVHKMLGNSSRLINPSDPETIIAAIREITKNHATFQKATALDVENNRSIMQQGIAIFKDFISHTAKD